MGLGVTGTGSVRLQDYHQEPARMSRQRRTAIGGQFAPRTIEMLRSPAWRVLSLSARRVLDRLEIELADHGGTDNGKLPVTYQDFVQYGIERHAIAPALREVVVLGFIEITERGRAGNAEFRRPSLYRLTYRHTRSAPTDEWRRIGEDEAEVIARAARAASTSKTENQCGKTPRFDAGNPHRKAEIHSGETRTTGLGGETRTTLDISGGVRSALLNSAVASTPSKTVHDEADSSNNPKSEPRRKQSPEEFRAEMAARGLNMDASRLRR
jgi:hypothetical protein